MDLTIVAIYSNLIRKTLWDSSQTLLENLEFYIKNWLKQVGRIQAVHWAGAADGAVCKPCIEPARSTAPYASRALSRRGRRRRVQAVH